MSDATDAVAQAVSRLKHLAATRLVEKEDLESRIAGLPPDDPQLPTLAADLAVADREYRAAMAEIAELKKLARTAEHAAARRVVTGTDDTDPFIRADEDLALDNVRAHLRDLEAQVKINDELGREPSEERDAGDEPPAPPPAGPRKRTM
jgi:hypothetical protein